MLAEFNIQRPDDSLRQKAIDKIDNLNKPKGSLGRLEDIALQLCLVQQTLSPKLKHPCHLLLGGDHGIEKEGVSQSPREVTWQQMINFTKGGGGVNMFCRQHNFKLELVDMGVDHDLSSYSAIKDCKIGWGTENFLYGPAMTEVQYLEALETGASLAEECIDEGCNILSIGEMGIANTSPSSIWLSLMGEIPLDDCIGAGSGLNTKGIEHKKQVLAQAVDKFLADYPDPTDEEIIMYFIMTACALAATRLYPECQDYMIFCHIGDESAHRKMLEVMGAKPLLSLGLRLGEGTGALCAYPIIESAVRMINEMNNFQNAKITKYF